MAPKKKEEWIKSIWSGVWTGLVATVVTAAIIYTGKDLFQKVVEASVQKNLKIFFEKHHDEPQWHALKTLECRLEQLEKRASSGLFGRKLKPMTVTKEDKDDYKIKAQKMHAQAK